MNTRIIESAHEEQRLAREPVGHRQHPGMLMLGGQYQAFLRRFVGGGMLPRHRISQMDTPKERDLLRNGGAGAQQLAYLREHFESLRCGMAFGGRECRSQRKVELELLPNAPVRWGLGLRQLQSFSQMFDGLGVRRTAECEISRLEPVRNCRVKQASLREMSRDDFRLARRSVGESGFERERDLGVQLMPASLDQAFVGRIPDDCVLGAAHGFRRFSMAEDELRLLELRKCLPQCVLIESD